MEGKNKKFRRKDFTDTEVLICTVCGEELSTCDSCGKTFDMKFDNEVACGKDDRHICRNCWESHLPEGE
jgi:hypothetical protein